MAIKAPVLTIKEKEYTMNPPKARIWRSLTKLQSKPDDVDTWVKVVSVAFQDQGITEDDIWNEIGFADLMPLSFQCISYVNDLVNEKLQGVIDSKNEEQEQA